MNLTNQSVKDTYGNVVTVGSAPGTPTTGTLANGVGQDLTNVTVDGDVNVTGNTTSDLFTVTTLLDASSATIDVQTLESVNIVSDFGYFSQVAVAANLGYNQTTDTYTPNSIGLTTNVTDIHLGMRRCVIDNSGQLEYYLDQNNSLIKEDGGLADLQNSGGGLQVMVEIPKFYYRTYVQSGVQYWSISDKPLSGYALHPAFFLDKNVREKRYVGAYQASVYSPFFGYIGPDNRDDNTGNVNLGADRLASVSGVYPYIGLTRGEFRTLAQNIGSYRLMDWMLYNAIQILYLVEYGTLNSQAVLGAGNSDVIIGGVTYPPSSNLQTDSPHSASGKSNYLGNASTDATSGASSSTRDTAFMSYRGIENIIGNGDEFLDGCVLQNAALYYTNNRNDYSDSSSANMQLLFNGVATASGFIRNIQTPSVFPALSYGFISTGSSGGASSTYYCDYHYGTPGSGFYMPVMAGYAMPGEGSLRNGMFAQRYNRTSSFKDRTTTTRIAH